MRARRNVDSDCLDRQISNKLNSEKRETYGLTNLNIKATSYT